MRPGSPRRTRHRLVAAVASVALIAAACGGDDDEPAAEEPAAEEPAAEEPAAEEPAAEEPAAEEPAAEEPAAEEPAAEEPAAEDPTAAEADDAIHGNGAERLESVINNPLGPADESLEPVVITMANLEGDALGSFPEIREGLEIAVNDINTNWGGIGGRPVELDVCVHGFDPNAAINCANEIAEAQPNLNINGIEFFTPALWPTFIGANIPTIQTVPIFVADFTVEGNGISPYGGCPVAFPGGASYTMEIRQFQKVAVVYANTPPGLECYADTEERFWQYLVDNEAAGAEFIGIPDNAGDPSDDDALVQQIADFFGETPGDQTAVFFGTQASDCNAMLSAVDAAGIDTTVVMSGSCIDDSVKANPAAADAEFSWQARISERPDLYEGWVRTEIEWREALLEGSDIRTVPVSAFLRVGHSAGVFAWNVLSEMVENGEDIDDADAVIASLVSLEGQHLIGAPPVSCTTNTAEFPSVCTKDITFVRWTGTDWDLEGSVLAGEFFSVADIQARVAAGNPRATG